MKDDIRKVAIIGAGFVGSTAAYALSIDGTADEIVLIDNFKEKAHGEALDLRDGIPFVENKRITFGDSYSLCKDADVIVITAGIHQKPGDTRLDLIHKNAGIMNRIMAGVKKYNKTAIILVVSNPVDVLTALVQRSYPAGKVFGSGTTLDTARLRAHLADHFHVSPQSVHAYILGEHGDSSFAAWSSARIGGVPLTSMKGYSKKKMQEIYKKVRNAAYEIIAKKGSTYYAIGLGITTIVRAILTNEKRIMPVSVPIKNYYGVSEVCLSLPSIIGRKGVIDTLHLPLNSLEQKQLRASAAILRSYLKKV